MSDSSWGSLGYREGHEAVPLLDGLAVHGGHSASPQNGDLDPPSAISVVSAALWRVRLSPLCATLEAATDTAANPSGFRQKANSTHPCFFCPKGSFYDTTTKTCAFCSPGTYNNLPGQVNACVPCPVGFVAEMYGSQAQQACTACPQGYYQPNTGQAACLACGSSSFCPVGSGACQLSF